MSKYYEFKDIFHTWGFGSSDSDFLVLDPYNSLVKIVDGGYGHLKELYYDKI